MIIWNAVVYVSNRQVVQEWGKIYKIWILSVCLDAKLTNFRIMKVLQHCIMVCAITDTSSLSTHIGYLKNTLRNSAAHLHRMLMGRGSSHCMGSQYSLSYREANRVWQYLGGDSPDTWKYIIDILNVYPWESDESEMCWITANIFSLYVNKQSCFHDSIFLCESSFIYVLDWYCNMHF